MKDKESMNYVVKPYRGDGREPTVYFKDRHNAPLSKRLATFGEIQRYDQLQATLRVEALLTEILAQLRKR